MSKVVLSGDLGFIGLGDLLQLVGSIGGTGVLRIISKYAPEPGLIYFQKGNITSAQNNLLKEKDRIGLDAVYSLFGWLEGKFEFSQEEVSVKKVITTNRMEIILDGLRMVDEGVVPILGPVSFEKKEKDSGEKERNIPVVKGPLVDYMYVVDEEEYHKGRTIVKENSHGSWIWVILEGVVNIVKETPKGPLTLLKIADGAFIGDLSSFSFKSTLRRVTAVADSRVILGVMDAQRLSNDFSERSLEFREFAMSIDNRLKEVTERSLEIYLKEDRFKEFARGKKLFKIKDEKLYTIRKGEASIIRKMKEGYMPVANLGKGDFVGHVPFLDIGHEPHSAAVFVSEDFEAGEVDTVSFREEYRKVSSTLKNMIDNLATCITITTSSASSFMKQYSQKKKKK
ncbi:cyclic nucleotide-binding domain-containing protein [Desulfococcaceae bacterium HSG8]|nr:cyclic nucleotide-binding domain-containing protein [Desulfococcaceae bacterium HSG8]